MADLAGSPGELRITLEVKRKDSGLVEVFDLIGTVPTESEKDDGRNALDRSA